MGTCFAFSFSIRRLSIFWLLLYDVALVSSFVWQFNPFFVCVIKLQPLINISNILVHYELYDMFVTLYIIVL